MKVVIAELNWPEGIQLLKQQDHTVVYDPELWKKVNHLKTELADADALIVRNQTQVNADLLQSAKRLKVIGRLGVGLDNIDLKTAEENNIPVVFAKNANAISVAEYVISALFSSTRLLSDVSEDVKAGNWNRKKFTKNELYGKTLGLIGVGEIGHRVATRASALGLNVVGYDPFITPFDFPVMESGILPVQLEDVLTQSDFISLHVPRTAQTHHLINKDAMDKMKSTSFIINSARGGIIHETDLYTALLNNTIGGAVLDVLEKEPPESDMPLLTLQNCIVTPHIAGLTEESQVRTSEMVANEIIGELNGNVSLCRVPLKR